MPSDLTVTLAGVIIAVAILGYWFGRSGESSGRLSWRFREFTDALPRRGEKAVDAYLREAEKEHARPDAAFELAAYFRSSGDWRRALQIHESLAARADLDAGARARAGLEIGDDYRSAGMLDRAEQAYSRTAEYAPLRLEALRRSLGVLEQLHEWEQALAVAGQLAREDPPAGRNLRRHYLCQMARDAAQGGDLRQAEKLWRQAAKGAKACARPDVDRALWGGRPLGQSLAVAARHPEWAELVLVGLVKRKSLDRGALDRELAGLLRDYPALESRLAAALLMAPDLLCASAAACLFSALRADYSAYARSYAEGPPADFTAEALRKLCDDLRKAAGGAPRWHCTACGQEDEAHEWRCAECGAWESARLISPFSD